jgi:hypothetical protein
MEGYVVHRLSVARGSSVRIDDGAGIMVYVQEGELWVTQEGDERDHFARPGNCFRIDCNGAVLLDATRDTRASFTAPTPQNYARRITLLPAGAAAPSVLYDASRQRGSWLESLRYRFRFLEKRRLHPGAL